MGKGNCGPNKNVKYELKCHHQSILFSNIFFLGETILFPVDSTDVMCNDVQVYFGIEQKMLV